MAENLIIGTGNKEEKYRELLPQLHALVSTETDLIANLANVAAALKQTFGFFWVGFYLVKEGKYNIHLGSGVIHQEGGAQIAVLPVHSQNRGRLFLPFVDEDPKTAEILTKIIFFAEDDKIKDPSILNQIK